MPRQAMSSFHSDPHISPASVAQHALAHPVDRGAALPAAIDSAQLLQGRHELVIRHGSECYRLRLTRNDKLILTK
jgi:hemin uptake protein HemP